MSGPQVFHFGNSDGTASNKNNEAYPGITKETVDESFLKLSRCWEEVEIHLLTSRHYVTEAKNSIEYLQKRLTYAEVDINKAKECVLESDARLRSLRVEIQSLFNRTLYPNLSTDIDETVRNEHYAQSNTAPLDEFSVPQHVSLALQKYAEKSNINLENYTTSFDRCDDGLMFIVMHPRSTILDDHRANVAPRHPSFSHRNETSDGKMQFKFAESVTSLHSPKKLTLQARNPVTDNIRNATTKRSECTESSHRVENLFVFPPERSLAKGQVPGGIVYKPSHKRRRSAYSSECTLAKSPDALIVGSQQATRESLQPRNNLPKECTRKTSPGDTSSFRLYPSIEMRSTKLMNRYEHQSEGILVRIDSSDSENEYEIVTKRNEMRKQCEAESEDLIEMFSSSCISETPRLSTEETDDENNSNIRHELRKGANITETLKLESRNVDLLHPTSTFRSEKKEASLSRSNLSKSAAELSCRPKTYSSSLINKRTRQISQHGMQEHSAICRGDSPDPVPQEDKILSNSESMIGLYFNSRPFNKSDKAIINHNDKIGCYSNKTKVKDYFDELEGKGLGGRCYSDQLYPKKIEDNSDILCFSTPQCKNRRHTLTNDTPSEKLNRTFHLGYIQKRSQSPLCSAKRKVTESEEWGNFLRFCDAKPFRDDENAPTFNDAVRDIFGSENRSRNRTRTFSKSPSYVSFPNEVLRHKQELELSDFDDASASTAIDMSFDSETEVSSRLDDVSTSNAIDMSTDSDTEFSLRVGRYDESLSSLNVDTSGSVYVEISEASINSRSTPEKETLSPFNDFPRSPQYGSLTSRDSVESFLTVYESSAGVGHCRSDEVVAETRNSATNDFSRDFDVSHKRRNIVASTGYPISKHFVSKCYSSHSPKPDYSP